MADNYQKIYVLDTNIILNDAENLEIISQKGENLILLPETVLEEIDSKKSLENQEIGFQARKFAQILKTKRKSISVDNSNDNAVITKHLLTNDVVLHTISLKKYTTELKHMDKSIRNDSKIIEAANFAKENIYKEYNQDNFIFITLDVMCEIRALSSGLKTEALSFNNKDLTYEYVIEIKTEKIPKEGEDIIKYNPNHKPENYGYKFIHSEKPGDRTLCYISNDKIKIVDENELKKSPIKPKNDEQALAMAAMQDIDKRIVMIDSLAGSGKNIISIASAMKCIDKGHYDKIVYIRNSVDSVDRGEEIGFLSGNDEKLAVYNHPLYDTLEFIVKLNKLKKKDEQKDLEDKISKLEEKYKIETMWIGAIRGRTITNAYVIIDEVQNFSRKSLQTVLSRLDDKCKVVIIGSNNQIDNPYLNKYTNGLSLLKQEFANRQTKIISKESYGQKSEVRLELFATELKEVVRGAITEWAEEVFKNK